MAGREDAIHPGPEFILGCRERQDRKAQPYFHRRGTLLGGPIVTCRERQPSSGVGINLTALGPILPKALHSTRILR